MFCRKHHFFVTVVQIDTATKTVIKNSKSLSLISN